MWAGPRALTDPFVIEGMRREKLRKDKVFAEKQHNKAVRASSKIKKLNEKLKELQDKGNEALLKTSNICQSSNFKVFLNRVEKIAHLRAISRWSHYLVHRRNDTSVLKFGKKNNIEQNAQKKKIIDNILNNLQSEKAIQPIFNTATNRWKLPPHAKEISSEFGSAIINVQ